jgi:16S rRNA (guanine966-N2)-methyltransferase
MRVVAGTAGGRRLDAPEGLDVRPTTDRVREAVFNALGSLDAIDGAVVLDLFAGTGALGIEALSRGAERATFVEPDRVARAAVMANLRTTGLLERAEVVPRSAEAYLAAVADGGEHFDVALLDPPYDWDTWSDLLEQVPTDFAVCESDRPVEVPDGWSVTRERSYGTTVVVFARRETGPAAATEDS